MTSPSLVDSPRRTIRITVVTSVLVAMAVLPGLLAFPASARAAASAALAAPAAEIISWVPVSGKLIALTFDAGSDAGHTEAILRILAEEGVAATFFLTGAWLENCPDLAALIVDRGHELGNHTQSHPHMTQLTDAEISDQLRGVEEKAMSLLGRSLKPYFRPPFGDYNERVVAIAATEGYPYTILWTVDSLDWKMLSPEELTQRVVSGARPGAIVLMHVGSQTHTPESLPAIIHRLRKDGYRLVTVGELLTARSSDVFVHTVSAGETLSAIAARYGITVADLTAANSISDPNLVRAGATLVIPGQGSGVEEGPGPSTGDDGPGGGPSPGENKVGSGDAGQPSGEVGKSFWVRLGAALVAVWEYLRNAASNLWGRFIGR